MAIPQKKPSIWDPNNWSIDSNWIRAQAEYERREREWRAIRDLERKVLAAQKWIVAGPAEVGGEIKEKRKPLPISTQFGEIIAHRFWRLHKGYLKAASNEFLWMPGKVATLKEGQKVEDHGSHGIHAFKALDRMLLQSYSGEIVFGRVKLWGDVIEYEHGYHAEFASIVSLDSVDLPSMKAHERTILDELRQRYGVSA